MTDTRQEFSETDRIAYRDRFHATFVHLDDTATDVVKGHKYAASAYVWGWQDGRPGDATDSLAAEIYGYAYGTTRALYMLGRIPYAPSMSWGWVKFRESGHVTELVAGSPLVLDMVSPIEPARKR